MIATIIAAALGASTAQPVQLAQGYDRGPPPGYDQQMNPDDRGPAPGYDPRGYQGQGYGQDQGDYGQDQGYGGPQGGDGDRPPSPQQMAQQLRQMGYSSAGVRILQAGNGGQPDEAMQRRGDQVQREIEAAANASPVDAARLGRALQASDALNAQIAAQRTADVMRILGQLSPSDRRIFARSLAAGPDQGGDEGPPPQGQPGGY